MSIDIQVSPGSPVPIYRQIQDQIRRGMAGGELAVGDQLPSVRTLAQRLVVNHNTVAKAYSELVRDGVIESRQGHGVFVAKKRQVYTKAERTRRLDRALEAFVSEAIMLDFTAEEIREAVEQKIEQLAGQTAGATR